VMTVTRSWRGSSGSETGYPPEYAGYSPHVSNAYQ
ncbi:uncharacterized protein METZ01_LOCUS342119, partial [marine metagenome]